MCDPLTVGLVAGGASLLSGAGAVFSGLQQKKMGDYQASQAEADAQAARAQAKVEADRIRKAGKAQAAQANASLAAAGVDTDEGTAVRITSGIAGDAEQDAYQTILNGYNQSSRLNAQAQADRIGGRNAATAGYVNAGGSLLNAGSNVYNGWKKGGAQS